MPLSLQPGESVLWKGRPAYKLRYPGLALVSFVASLAVYSQDPVSRNVGVALFFVFLVSIPLILYSTVRYATTDYYITTKRLASDGKSIDLQDLAGIRIQQDWLARALDRGNIFFDSATGKWVLFKRVRHPDAVKQGALNAKSQLPIPRVPCEYCGKLVAKGTRVCPECGAKLWNTGPGSHRI